MCPGRIASGSRSDTIHQGSARQNTFVHDFKLISAGKRRASSDFSNAAVDNIDFAQKACEGYLNLADGNDRPSRSSMRVVMGLQSRIDHTSVGLRPHFVFGQIGVQLGEVKRGVDAVTLDVLFNLSKLLSESPAILVILLDVAHSLSLLLSDGACYLTNSSSVRRSNLRKIRPRQTEWYAKAPTRWPCSKRGNAG